MAHSKTSRTEIPESTKNQFIGAMKISGKLRQSAELLGIKRSTASDIWQRYKSTGSSTNLHRSGRPSKLNDRGQRAVMREILKDRKKPFPQIAKDVPGDISPEIVRKVADSEGYHRRVARKVPFLTARQKKKRLDWAEDFDGIDEKEWDNLLPSDECYVQLDDSNGRIFVTRRPEEEYDENCVIPNFKQSSVRVMIWGCFMRGVKGPLVVLEYPGGKGGGMDTDRYISQVLEAHLSPFYHKMEKERPGIVFQQDGAPSHTAKRTKKWLANHNIDLFPHPPNSPDLNPIEPLWHDLKTIIRSSPHLPNTVPKLIKAIQDAWEKLPISDLDKHIRTMPDRVQAVLAAKGGHTRF
jgi:transposase